jgi:uncharacterized membrane protein YdbT with pleckstrin-like domain
MSFVSRSLAPDERIVARAHLHWIYTLRAVLALVFLGIVVIGFVIFIRSILKKANTEIVVTNRRFIMKSGVFNVQVREFTLNNIEGMQISQGFWGQIFGYGTLIIEGTGNDHYELPMMANPVEFSRAIEGERQQVTQASVSVAKV